MSKSLAIVVIGGLISSTILTLILVPVLYSLVEGFKERRMEKQKIRDLTRDRAAAATATICGPNGGCTSGCGTRSPRAATGTRGDRRVSRPRG